MPFVQQKLEDMKKPVDVITYHVDVPNKKETRTIDYDNHFSRLWLSKHIMWAMHNDNVVLIEPVQFEEG